MSSRHPITASVSDMRLRAGTISLVLATALATVIVFAPLTHAQTFTVLHNFTGGMDGANPHSGLTMDRAGNLYGTALNGGINNCPGIDGCGTVFKLSRQGAGFIFRPLYQFQGHIPNGDGAGPLGRVIFGPDGALYGTTAYGGSSAVNCASGGEIGCGSAFKLTPPATPCRSFTCNWQETQLHSFVMATDGAFPQGEIVFDSAGNLYGGAETGGTARAGTVYELSPAQGTWTLTVLHDFAGGLNDGQFPLGGVQLDPAGNIYGTTAEGGNGDGEGIVFQLVPSGSSWTLNILYNFQLSSGGITPTAGVIVGPGGNLYGGTPNGRPNPVVFELSPSNGSWTYSTLYTFNSDFCCGMGANLVMDSAGNLYGTTGGDSVEGIYGTVFKLTPSNGGWIYTDLHDFTGGSDGATPESSVLIDANGNLYGTAEFGGNPNCTGGCGTVWEITP